jgi:hypothetical protein
VLGGLLEAHPIMKIRAKEQNKDLFI